MRYLNLPKYDCLLKEEEGKTYIWCLIRKKYIFLFPEEWVRQHFLNLLLSHLSYPKSMIKLEQSIVYRYHKKRSDIVVYRSDGSIFILIECKAPTVKLGKNVLQQVAVYNTKVNARYLAITNGMKHFIWQKKENRLETVRDQFPVYSSK